MLRISGTTFVAMISLVSVVHAQTPSPGTQEGPTGITVTDARSKPEVSEWLGFWSSDCNTGIRRLGDEKTNPSRMVVLQNDLRAALSNKYAGSALLVTKYSIFYNMSYWLQRENPAANGMLGGILVANGCTKDKTVDGWYSPDEVTTQYVPVIVEIEASLNGKAVSSRIVYSPTEDITGSWGLFGNKSKGEAALAEAMRQANAKLIAQINAL